MRRFALAFVASLAAAPGTAVETVRIISLPARVSELDAKPVTDFARRPLGRVADVTLDLANGRVRHVIVETPQGTRPVPFHIFTPALDGERLLLDASRERLARAPEWTGGAEAYWSAPQPPRLGRSSALLGRPFRSADGDLGGTLADVVIDAHEGNVVFAVVALGPGKLHPVPLRAFTLGDELVLELDARSLERGRDLEMRELEQRLTDADFLEKTAAYADRLAATASRRR